MLPPSRTEQLDSYFGEKFITPNLGYEQLEKRHALGQVALDRIQTLGQEQGDDSAADELAALGRRVHIWNMMSQTRSDEASHNPIGSLVLRPPQIAPFRTIVRSAERLDETVTADDTLLEALSLARLGQLPTGGGKTIAAIHAAYHWGVGSTMPNGEKLKAFLLVPTVDIREQFMYNQAKGFAKFWPGLKIHDLAQGERGYEEADIRLASYALLARMTTADVVRIFADTAIGLADEAQFLLAEKQLLHLPQLIEGRIFRGLTATPTYSETNSLRNIMRQDVRIDMREGLENGMVRPAELYAIDTGTIFSAEVQIDDYSSLALQELANNDIRNQLIVDLAAEQVESGRQGLIQCIRGVDEKGLNCAHAYGLAESLSQRMIIPLDKDGQELPERLVVARAVASTEPKSEQYKKEFEEGKIDILLYVDKLGIGYDSENVGFMLYARPTRSDMVLLQNFGRGGRSGRYATCVHIQLMDRLHIRDMRNLPASLFKLLGLSKIYQGMIVGSRTRPLQPTDNSSEDTTTKPKWASANKPHGPVDPDTSYNSLLHQHARSTGTHVLDMAYIGWSIQSQAEKPKDWISIDAICPELLREAKMDLILNEFNKGKNFQDLIYVARDGDEPYLCISPEAKAWLTAQRFIIKGPDDIELTDAAALIGVPRSQLKRMLSAEISPAWSSKDKRAIIYTVPGGKIREVLRYAQYKDIQAKKRIPLIEVIRRVNEAMPDKDDPDRRAFTLHRLGHVAKGLGRLVYVQDISTGAVKPTYGGKLRSIDYMDADAVEAVINATLRKPIPETGIRLDKLVEYLSPAGRKIAPSRALNEFLEHIARSGVSQYVAMGVTEDQSRRSYVDRSNIATVIQATGYRIIGHANTELYELVGTKDYRETRSLFGMSPLNRWEASPVVSLSSAEQPDTATAESTSEVSAEAQATLTQIERNAASYIARRRGKFSTTSRNDFSSELNLTRDEVVGAFRRNGLLSSQTKAHATIDAFSKLLLEVEEAQASGIGVLSSDGQSVLFSSKVILHFIRLQKRTR
jgi:superfamily II DNA or RNA helicase